MNFAKKYNFLKNLKSTSSSYSMQSMIYIENQLSGFCFKITFTENELRITNHEIYWFLNRFRYIKD